MSNDEGRRKKEEGGRRKDEGGRRTGGMTDEKMKGIINLYAHLRLPAGREDPLKTVTPGRAPVRVNLARRVRVADHRWTL